MKIPFAPIARVVTPAIVLALAMLQPAYAGPPKPLKLDVDPWAFVGTAAECAPSPAGTEIVASGWVKDFGLPDAKGKHSAGLELSKNGPTTDCSAAGAAVDGVKGIVLATLSFDYRNSMHCGAGAPRFNIVASDGFHFGGGCSNATHTPVVGQPGWTHAAIDPANPAQMFPVIAAGATIVSIDIVFDEGTDTGPDLTGFAIMDNIEINGVIATKN